MTSCMLAIYVCYYSSDERKQKYDGSEIAAYECTWGEPGIEASEIESE